MSAIVDKPLVPLAPVAITGFLVAGCHNPVDATAAPLTMMLPNSIPGDAQGARVSVEKYDSSVNAVTISGSIRGVPSSTRVLTGQGDTLYFVADLSGSFWPIADHQANLGGTFATESQLATETARAETAEALLAPLVSPALTGTPTAPTKSALTNNTDIATTAYADAAVAVETTRAETAEALKAPLISPALTGTPTTPTRAPLTNNTDIASTAYADAAVAVETARATTAEGLLIPGSQKGVASGVATLDGSGKLAASQIPALAVNTVYSVASQAAMLALAANPGDMAVRSDTAPAETFMLAAAPASTLANWVQISIDASLVTQVAGRTGAVTLTVADVSGAAPLASPALTGAPTAPTAAALDNSTKLATTAYADTGIGVEKTRAQAAEGARLVAASDLADVGDAGSSRYNLGISLLGAAQAATTLNHALSGLPTLDGYTATAGERVFLGGQTVPSQNGPWIVASGSWTRPTDYPSGGVIGASVIVINNGPTYGGSIFTMSGASVTIDTTASVWAMATPSAAGSLIRGIRVPQLGIGSRAGNPRIPNFTNIVLNGPNIGNSGLPPDDMVGALLDMGITGGFTGQMTTVVGGIPNGSSTVTLTSGTWGSATTGWTVVIPGAGPAGATLTTTLTATPVGLVGTVAATNTSGSAVTGASINYSLSPDPQWIWGADDYIYTGTSAGDIAGIQHLVGREVEIHIAAPDAALSGASALFISSGIEKTGGGTVSKLLGVNIGMPYNLGTATGDIAAAAYIGVGGSGTVPPGFTKVYGAYLDSGISAYVDGAIDMGSMSLTRTTVAGRTRLRQASSGFAANPIGDAQWGPTWAGFLGGGGGRSIGYGTGSANGTASGVAATSAHPVMTNYVTAATLGARAGFDFGGAAGASMTVFRGASTDIYAGWVFKAKGFYPDASYNAAGASTGTRLVIGLTSSPTTSLGADHMGATSCAAFCRSNVNGGATDTNWQFVTNNAGGSPTVVDTGIPFTPSHLYEATINCPAGSTTIYWQLNDLTAGTSQSGSAVATLPVATTALFPLLEMSTVDATARNVQLADLWVQADKG